MWLHQIQLKSLAEEMQAVSKGLEKVEQELTAAENDGAVSSGFRKVRMHDVLIHTHPQLIKLLLEPNLLSFMNIGSLLIVFCSIEINVVT